MNFFKKLLFSFFVGYLSFWGMTYAGNNFSANIHKYTDSIEKESTTTMFLNLLADKLETISLDKQEKVLKTVIEKLSAYSSPQLAVFGINKSELVVVLDYVLNAREKESVASNHETSGMIKYDVYPAKDTNQKVVVFKLESPKQIRRATRHRPDGSTYTCEMDQCKQIPRVWEEGKSYEVVVYVTYSRTESSREVLQINVGDYISSSILTKDNPVLEQDGGQEATTEMVDVAGDIVTDSVSEKSVETSPSVSVDFDNLLKTHDQAVVTDKIFKVKSWEHDTIGDNFVYRGYGSAVLVAKDKLLTNAHVVLGQDNKPGGYYEVCKSDGVCFDTASLLFYNKEKDLALLQMAKEVTTEPVHINEESLQMGDEVRILGYPSNSDGNITLTKGIISGNSKGKYTIDANLDAGNSGGGGFDAENRLVGIPTYVVQGYTTLGYVIPLSDVVKFLGDEASRTSFKTGKSLSPFVSFIHDLHQKSKTNQINDVFFTLKNIDKHGFHVKDMMMDKNNEVSSYILTNENESMSIMIQTSKEYGHMSDEIYDTLIDEGTKVLEKQGATITKEEKQTKNGNTTVTVRSVDKQNELSTYINNETCENVSYEITTDDKESIWVQKGIDLYLDEFICHGKSFSSDVTAFSLGNLSFPVRDVNVSQGIDLFGRYDISFLMPVKAFHMGMITYRTIPKEKVEQIDYKSLTSENFMVSILKDDESTDFKEGTGTTAGGMKYYYYDAKMDETRMKNYMFFVNPGGEKDIEMFVITVMYDETKSDLIRSPIETFIKNLKFQGTFPNFKK